jgi:hypothetical protein
MVDWTVREEGRATAEKSIGDLHAFDPANACGVPNCQVPGVTSHSTVMKPS